MGTILAVDDQSSVFSAYRVLFEPRHSVVATTSPNEAIRIVKRQPVDLMLVDIVMEEMDGFEVIRRCYEIKPEMKYAVVSGYGKDSRPIQDPNSIDFSKTVGTILTDLRKQGIAAEYLQKPVGADELIELVKSLIENK